MPKQQDSSEGRSFQLASKNPELVRLLLLLLYYYIRRLTADLIRKGSLYT